MARMKLYITAACFLAATTIIALAARSSLEKNYAGAEKLYKEHCSKCHRNNGKGIRNIYPPLLEADYIKNNSSEELLRGMLFGRSGTITVNGKKYTGVMTTEVDKSLTDDDIALILNFVYDKYNGMDKRVGAEDVKKARAKGPLPKH